MTLVEKEPLKPCCKKCGQPATWVCSGEFARFGVPLDTYYCDSCKSTVTPRPKIMDYNRFPLKWTRLAELEQTF
jgi:hypothetical protein